MKISVIVLAVALIAGAVSTGAEAYYSTDWTREDVDKLADTQGDCGWYTSLALDANDNPRISYYSDGMLKFASHNGGSWTIEIVDSVSRVGEGTSLALDSSGNPGISYCDITSYDLKYAYHNGSTWTIETIDSTGWVGYYSSLEFNASDRPRMSYYDASNGDLKFAKYTGVSWIIETVDDNGWVGLYTSLELNPSSLPRISYYDSTNTALKYASYSVGSWTTETVYSAGSFAGKGNSLALDQVGSPNIAFYYVIGGGASVIKYAYKSGGGWAFDELPSGGPEAWAGPFMSIIIESDGKPRISHTGLAKNKSNNGERKNPTLKYGIKEEGSWNVSWVDGGKTDDAVELKYKGFYNSIAVGSDGKARISYLDSGENKLMYAIDNR